MKRREYISLMATLGVTSLTPAWAAILSTPIMKRKIPSSGEDLPVIGIGTWQTFNVRNMPDELAPLKEVLNQFIEQGGSVVDSSPMYGRSEKVIGDLSTELEISDKLFMATKVWTSGREAGIKQMENSFAMMRREQMDLMQIHNLIDWETHYKTLRQWKEDGKIRYHGITHYMDNEHSQVEYIIRNNPFDFIQINYSITDRHAAESLLHVAQEKKVGVIINQPFGGGDLFESVQGKPVPEWAKEFDCTSWGCFFLKFILAHPAVTCVIPGTSKLSHMIDNLSAGVGRLPDEKQRQRMISFIEG